MKTINLRRIGSLMLLLFASFIITSCDDNDVLDDLIDDLIDDDKYENSFVINFNKSTSTKAYFTGTIDVSDDDLASATMIIYYGRAEGFNPESSEFESTREFDEDKNFKLVISNLNPKTNYKYRAELKVGEEKVIGDILEFTTKESSLDYVDEYGVNHGEGIMLKGVIWAPVNCGYHETDYRAGKLYQWGRKYGQGYGSKTSTEVPKDSTYPEIIREVVEASVGNNPDNANNFYAGSSSSRDWQDPENSKAWNAGTEESPIKTEFDPCPDGWRVPTRNELDKLRSLNINLNIENEFVGVWIIDKESGAEDCKIFLPCAGARDSNGVSKYRHEQAWYWSSVNSKKNAALFLQIIVSEDLTYASFSMTVHDRIVGTAVRCVQIM